MRWRFTLVAAAYTAGVLILSSIPAEPGPELLGLGSWAPPEVQNLAHIPLYAGLSLLWCLGLSDHLVSPTQVLGLALAIAIGVGALDEWNQAFVPGRFASLTDATLNTLGAAVGVLLWRRARRPR
jgi:VanZ family protein